MYKRQDLSKINQRYIERIKLANDMNNATYLLLWYLLFDDFVNKINRAPIVGNIIKDEMIGKSIILKLTKLVKLRNQEAL